MSLKQGKLSLPAPKIGTKDMLMVLAVAEHASFISAAAYLKTSAADVAEKANQFYESLPTSEKFVPLSARAARRRKETGGSSSPALF